MGVRRAVDMALRAAENEQCAVYTHGPLIHNPQALEELRTRGVIPLAPSNSMPRGTVVIRAHGVPPKDMERIGRTALRVVDATCPKVSTIQQRIAEYSGRGYAVVIAGDADHPEVVGLLGHAEGLAFVISRPEEVDDLPGLGAVLLVAQSTQDEEVFMAIRERLLRRFPQAEALSTICQSTHRRQSEVRRMAGQVDALVVIGGRNSANTRRLAEISQALGTPAHHVETAAELPLDELRKLSKVGITAGASTPAWIIEQVVETLARL
jgi:4-hydroxy-3-methylbut-2-enyl diphosphate reductase